MSRSTPWGAAQQVIKHGRGISTVCTASHGGLMISEALAKKLLSGAARELAIKHNGYYCFEEDCLALIPLLDSDVVRKAVFTGDRGYFQGKTEAEIRAELIRMITIYNHEYLLAVGIEPDPEEYQIVLWRAEGEALRMNAPESVVMHIWDDWYTTLAPGTSLVTTDAGTSHYVTTASLDNLMSDKRLAMLMPISALEIVEPASLPSIEERVKAALSAEVDKEKANNNTANARMIVAEIQSAAVNLLMREKGMSREDAKKQISVLLDSELQSLSA